MVPDPRPLAYSLYAFINVDNCEQNELNEALGGLTDKHTNRRTNKASKKSIM